MWHIAGSSIYQHHWYKKNYTYKYFSSINNGITQRISARHKYILCAFGSNRLQNLFNTWIQDNTHATCLWFPTDHRMCARRECRTTYYVSGSNRLQDLFNISVYENTPAAGLCFPIDRRMCARNEYRTRLMLGVCLWFQEYTTDMC